MFYVEASGPFLAGDSTVQVFSETPKRRIFVTFVRKPENGHIATVSREVLHRLTWPVTHSASELRHREL